MSSMTGLGRHFLLLSPRSHSFPPSLCIAIVLCDCWCVKCISCCNFVVVYSITCKSEFIIVFQLWGTPSTSTCCFLGVLAYVLYCFLFNHVWLYYFDCFILPNKLNWIELNWSERGHKWDVIARRQFSKIPKTACISSWEFKADKSPYAVYVTRHWNWMNSYWMFRIGSLRGARWELALWAVSAIFEKLPFVI